MDKIMDKVCQKKSVTVPIKTKILYLMQYINPLWQPNNEYYKMS